MQTIYTQTNIAASNLGDKPIVRKNGLSYRELASEEWKGLWILFFSIGIFIRIAKDNKWTSKGKKLGVFTKSKYFFNICFGKYLIGFRKVAKNSK